MRTLIASAACLCTCIISCKKNTEKAFPVVSAVAVVNAVVDMPAVYVNYSGISFIYAASKDSLVYGAGKIYSLNTGAQNVLIVPKRDTARQLISGSFNLDAGGIYSLFLVGQSAKPDTLYRKETITRYADSLIGIRFVNASPNSSPVTVTIKGAVTPEITALAFKGISDIKTYPARLPNPSYVFEIRDAATSALLTTYTFTVAAANRFKNVSLVLRGLSGTTTGANAFGVSTVNYF